MCSSDLDPDPLKEEVKTGRGQERETVVALAVVITDRRIGERTETDRLIAETAKTGALQTTETERPAETEISEITRTAEIDIDQAAETGLGKRAETDIDQTAETEGRVVKDMIITDQAVRGSKAEEIRFQQVIAEVIQWTGQETGRDRTRTILGEETGIGHRQR